MRGAGARIDVVGASLDPIPDSRAGEPHARIVGGALNRNRSPHWEKVDEQDDDAEHKGPTDEFPAILRPSNEQRSPSRDHDDQWNRAPPSHTEKYRRNDRCQQREVLDP